MKYGCHCELEDDQEPDECVIDLDGYTRNDCVHAQKGINKEDCKYWKPIDNPVELWYTYPVQDRLQICKMISYYLGENEPLYGTNKRKVDKTDMMDYIMKKSLGHYNPKVVKNIINFMFGDMK